MCRNTRTLVKLLTVGALNNRISVTCYIIDARPGIDTATVGLFVDIMDLAMNACVHCLTSQRHYVEFGEINIALFIEIVLLFHNNRWLIIVQY